MSDGPTTPDLVELVRRTAEAHITEWRAGMAVRVTVYTDLEQGRVAGMRAAEERAPADV